MVGLNIQPLPHLALFRYWSLFFSHLLRERWRVVVPNTKTRIPVVSMVIIMAKLKHEDKVKSDCLVFRMLIKFRVLHSIFVHEIIINMAIGLEGAQLNRVSKGV